MHKKFPFGQRGYHDGGAARLTRTSSADSPRDYSARRVTSFAQSTHRVSTCWWRARHRPRTGLILAAHRTPVRLRQPARPVVVRNKAWRPTTGGGAVQGHSPECGFRHALSNCTPSTSGKDCSAVGHHAPKILTTPQSISLAEIYTQRCHVEQHQTMLHWRYIAHRPMRDMTICNMPDYSPRGIARHGKMMRPFHGDHTHPFPAISLTVRVVASLARPGHPALTGSFEVRGARHAVRGSQRERSRGISPKQLPAPHPGSAR
jgi:hypothetical protein